MNGRNKDQTKATFDAPAVLGSNNDRVDPGQEEVYLVIPLDRLIEVGDEIIVTLASDDTSPRRETLHATNQGGYAATLHLAPDYLTAHDGQAITASYSVTGKADSVPYVFHVGPPKAELPAPEVLEAAAGNLLPVAAKDGATVRVPAALAPADSIVVHFGNYDSPPVAWKAGLTVLIPPAEVAKVLGTTIEVTYTVNGADTSQALDLHVLDFADNDPSLPSPVVNQASGGVVDLSTFTGKAKVAVAPWPLIATGQRTWLRAEGTKANGTRDTHPLRENTAVTASEVTDGLLENLPRTWLQGLKDGSQLTLRLSVNFAGAADEASSKAFPPRSYTLKLAKPLSIDTSLMTLEVGESEVRTATGGSPPYAYRSANAAIATVNASGRTTGVAAGSTTITATDSIAASVGYSVQVKRPVMPGGVEDFESAPVGNLPDYLDRPLDTLVLVSPPPGSVYAIRSAGTSPMSGRYLYVQCINRDHLSLTFHIRPKSACRSLRFAYTASLDASNRGAFIQVHAFHENHGADEKLIESSGSGTVSFTSEELYATLVVTLYGAALSIDNVEFNTL
ncbi:Ig-like domain-containing protein [Luteibacter yeojuensis]|uniref:BIG2 domain-containing protein n=1 Tax=Luteibacter yeojuensis TaxID=345309 RepID=A0A0F3K199_9GAMM|nr:Ig-like domain-containing protein [Luteibacter yeojuensis]KJV24946.1 hypothetical protein VI08_20090 [Luteibacter yeojuensis]